MTLMRIMLTTRRALASSLLSSSSSSSSKLLRTTVARQWPSSSSSSSLSLFSSTTSHSKSTTTTNIKCCINNNNNNNDNNIHHNTALQQTRTPQQQRHPNYGCTAAGAVEIAAVNRRYFCAAAASPVPLPPPNSIPFVLADIGEGIKEVEVMQWFVQPGDTVQQFDKICEVQSDKATVEITSRYDGVVVALAGAAGDMLQVGSPLLYFAKEGQGPGSVDDTTPISNISTTNDFSTTTSAATTTAAATESTVGDSRMLQDTESPDMDTRLRIPTIASRFRLASDHPNPNINSPTTTMTNSESELELYDSNTKFLASPAVRKLGKEYHLNLATIQGSGPKGRLLKSDVLTYLREQGYTDNMNVPTTDTTTTTTTATTATTPLSSATSIPAAAAVVNDDGSTIFKLKGYNRYMVQSMTAALQIPHMTFGDEIVMDALQQTRQALKKDHVNISIMTLLIKAVSMALTEYPHMNAIIHNLEACELKVFPHHDIGIAMDTSRGLVVPVLRNVQQYNVLELEDELNRLKVAAREFKLSTTDLDPPPTFTLSNVGALGGGGTYMSPVIVPPQLAMGAMGMIQTLPRYNDQGQVVPVSVMNVSWAGDHRVLDGATLARFNGTFKKYVQHPVQMLVHMK